MLILGLGCESNQLEPLLQEIPQSQRAHIRTFAAQADVGRNRRRACALVEELVDIAARAEREPCPIASLAVGLKCGGSDGFSGITANPLVGRIADRVTERRRHGDPDRDSRRSSAPSGC